MNEYGLRKPPWETFYQILNKYSQTGDLILVTHPVPYGHWRAEILVGKEFYLKKELIGATEIGHGNFTNNAATLQKLLESGQSPKRVFLTHHWISGLDGPRTGKDLFYFQYDRVGLVGAQVKNEDWKDTLLRLLKFSKDLLSDKELHGHFLELELEIHLHRRDRSSAEKVLAQLVSIGFQEIKPEEYKNATDRIQSL